MSAFSRELRSFLTVSQSSSIRDAAEQLNVSAPALSRQMQILEQAYNVKLLVRSPNGIALTSSGETLRDQASQWLKSDADMAQKLRRAQDGEGLLLRIGIMECLAGTFIKNLQSALSDMFGDVTLEIIVGSTDVLLAEAEALRLDLLIAFNMPRLERHIVTETYEYYIGVVCRNDHIISGTNAISLQDALAYPLCLPGASLSFHQRLLAEILSVRVNPKICVQSNSINVIKQAVAAGDNIAFLTWIDVREDVENGALSFQSLKSKRLTETLSLTICRGNNLSDKTGRIIEIIRHEIAQMGA